MSYRVVLQRLAHQDLDEAYIWRRAMLRKRLPAGCVAFKTPCKP
jgi:hypothetical protein